MFVYSIVYIHVVPSLVYLYLGHVGLDGSDQDHHHDAAQGDVGEGSLRVPRYMRDRLKVKSNECQSTRKSSNADITSYLQYMRCRQFRE